MKPDQTYKPYPPRCSRNVRGQDPVLDDLVVAFTALESIDLARLAAADAEVFPKALEAWRNLAYGVELRLASHGMDAFWESPTHRAWIGGRAPGTLRIKSLTQEHKHES